MADWMPKSARPYRPASAKPDVGYVESALRGVYQGAGADFADEQAGALDAIGGHFKRTFTNDWKKTGDWGGDIEAEAGQVADDYRQGRDESRQAYAEAEEANPLTYGAGKFIGAVATGLLTGGASALGKAGLKGALTAGALEGAAGGLGGSNADLTHADLDAYAKAFRDSTEGGVIGAGFGAGLYGAGKGLKWVGGKAVDGLRRAHGELAEGVAAERELADEAARAAEDKAARAEAKRAAKAALDAERAKVKQQKEFRAANERTQVDKRYADPNAAPLPRAGRPARASVAPEGPVEDPNTAILGGYRGKAGERRAVNYDRVRQYRQDIADPNFTGDRGRLEQYAREYGDAVDNPGAFERRMVERYLRENYPPEVADRIMRERVGPNGEILPRRPAAPVDASEPTRASTPASNASAAQSLSTAEDTYAQARRLVPGQAYLSPVMLQRRLGIGYDRAVRTLERLERDGIVSSPPPGKGGWVVVQPEPATQAASIGEIAEAMGENPRYLRQRDSGLGAQDLGAGRFGDETFAYPNADIRRSQVPSGDPFHDAPTKVGLVRLTPPEGVPGENRTPYHKFQFKDPKSGDIFEIQARESPFDDEGIIVDGFGPAFAPKDWGYEQVAELTKNMVGPRTIRDALAELSRAFPGRTRIGGMRATGISPGRDTSIPAPEVTQVQPRGAIRGANPPGDFERTIAARNAENLPASGRRAAKEWETLEQTEVNGLPAIPRGMRRLYRGEAYGGRAPPPSEYPAGSLNAEDIQGADGRWFTDRAGVAHEYARRSADISEGTPIAKYIDVPEGEARSFRMDSMPEGRFSDEAFREWLPPKALVRDAEIMPTPKDVPLGLDEGMNANVPFWNRGIGDDAWPEKVFDEVSPEDATQRINLGDATQRMSVADMRQIIAKSENPDLLAQRQFGLNSDPQSLGAARFGENTIAYSNRDILRAQDAVGDVTQVGREPPVSGDDLRQWLDLTQEMPIGTPEGLPPLEDITSPGAPSFPSDVRRAQPFQAPPQLRPQYRPQPPPEAVPTRDLRPASPPAAAPRPAPVYDPNNSMVSPRDFDSETVVPLGDTQVPRSPRPAPYAGPVAPELAPEPVLANPLRQARPRPLAPPVAPPSQTVMGAPPGSLVRQARPSVEELAMQREQGALGDVLNAGWEGARSANNALAAPFGAAYGIGKEALQNPAVRARAISLFRLDRLARVRPEVWARVGPTLQRAFQSGPERFKAERHVLLLRDPEFRAAEAEADAELERMDGQPPTRRAMAR